MNEIENLQAKLYKTEYLLQEQQKVLTCLYEFSGLVENSDTDLDKIFSGLVEIIPRYWQHPQIAYAGISYQGRNFRSTNYQHSPWKQTADIYTEGLPVGFLEVGYVEERYGIDEQLFLDGERKLVNIISERLGRIIERINNTNALETEKEALKNKNIALREFMNQLNLEKQEIAERIQTNIERIVLPMFYNLEQDARPEQTRYLTLMKQSLLEITNPLINQLSKNFTSLTTTELQICNMIKSGLSTKEIAVFRGLSVSTIHHHRENIRRKLGIINEKINLGSYLATYLK
jgi:DNA-binding CsgD family transcriptional regulator